MSKPWAEARRLGRAMASRAAARSPEFECCRYCGAGGQLLVGSILGDPAYFCYKCEPSYRAAKARLERERE